MAGKLSSLELQICRDALASLTSKENSEKNFLFLEPVDLKYFPTYTQLVKRPMDLGTLGKNLESGLYKSRDAFFADAIVCFENAMAFHKDKPENAWIVKYAKDMKKIASKERKRAEKKIMEATGGMSSGAVPSLKLKMGKKDKSSSSEKAKYSGSDRREHSDESKQQKSGKLKLSLKAMSNKGDGDLRAPTPKEKKKKKKDKSSRSNSSSPRDLNVAAGTTSSNFINSSSNVNNSVSNGTNTPQEAQAPAKMKLSLKLKKDPEKISTTPTPSPLQPSSSSQISKLKKSKKRDKDQQGEKKISVVKAKPSKPKLKLTLSLNKKVGLPSSGNATPVGGEKIEEKPKSKLSPTINISSSTQKQKQTPSINIPSSGQKQDKQTTKISILTSGQKQEKQSPKISISTSSQKQGKVTPTINISTSSQKQRQTSTINISTSQKQKQASSPASGHPPSRGKELPSAVAAAQQQAKKNSTSSSSTNVQPSTHASKPSGESSSSTVTSKKTTSVPQGQTSAPPSRGKELPKGVSTATEPNRKIRLSISGGSSSKNKGDTSKTKSESSKGKNEDGGNNNSSSNSESNMKAVKKPSQSSAPKSTSAFTSATKTSSRSITSSSASSSSTNKVGTSSSSDSHDATTAVGIMNPSRKAQCSKVLSALKRRNPKHVQWFLKPVNDRSLIGDYRAKIPNPMDLGTISTKLDKNLYPTVSDFVLDVRRVFANCLRFNAEAGNTFRPMSKEMITSAEDLMNLFIAKVETQGPVYPKLLYCWKTCLQLLDSIIALKNVYKNTDNEFPTAHYFLHPVSFYFKGPTPPEYDEKVKVPMDLGTITSKLFEGFHQTVDDFVADCHLVPANCRAFYGERDDGAMYTSQASILDKFMSQHLEKLQRYDRSPLGIDERNRFLNAPSIKVLKPPKTFLTSMLQELRNSTYTDKFTKLSEPATRQFEEPVNQTFFPDYLQYVLSPMDLKSVDNRIEADSYETPEDFEYDVALIFKNCEAYNVPKRNDHIVNLAKHCAKTFRKIYSSRIKAFEASGGKVIYGEEKKKRSHSPATCDVVHPNKKVKTDSSSSGKSGKGTRKPLLSTPPTELSGSVSAPPRAKSPKAGGGKKRNNSKIVTKTDGPVPLHVAIAQIKEGFSERRLQKDLGFWEGACYRFFRELLRHPWLSAHRPKFIFHVPVPILFPEIKEAYAAKITNPMDLTTAECKLLQGGIYTHAQEFVDDVALVFANAVTFNKDGQEEGEAMSCAYFDASRHLLRYSRWLSLEHLAPFLVDDSQSEGAKQQGPISHWKLTTSNRKDSREEMESMVMNQKLDKSEEGDRYTWMEAECEKLLKSLRHQTDSKKMTYFIQPKYPDDYFAYVSKPMDWETCQKNLQQRNYNTFGEIVQDLRLIFSNAQKYNARAKGTETVSGCAYDSAIHMSKKLELGIDRLLLTVSDHLERDKIDHVIAEREAEAKEQAEEERLRTEWQKEREKSRHIGSKERVTTVETVKIIQRRAPVRRDMDFEFPFYDEEPTHEQSHMEALNQQKMIYDKQLKAHKKMQSATRALGFNVFDRLLEQQCAIAWAKKLSEKILSSLSQPKKNDVLSAQASGDMIPASTNAPPPLSNVSGITLQGGSSRIKLCIGKSQKSKKKRASRLILT